MSYGKSSITGARQARTAIAIKLGVHANIKPSKIAVTTLIDASLRRGGRAHPCFIGRSRHGPRFKPSRATPGSGAVETSPLGENRPIIWGGTENGPGRLGSPGPKSWEVLQLNVATDAYMGGIAGRISHPVAPSNLRAITQVGPCGAVRPKASECELARLALPIGQGKIFSWSVIYLTVLARATAPLFSVRISNGGVDVAQHVGMDKRRKAASWPQCRGLDDPACRLCAGGAAGVSALRIAADWPVING
jgi:hypothetical protein